MAKIITVPKWVMPFGYGLTLWKLIIIREDGDRDYLIAHELKHVEQWTTIGFFKFPFYYILELIENGYTNNHYEIEAREAGRKAKWDS